MTIKNKLNQLRARMVAWGDINKREVKQGAGDGSGNLVSTDMYLLPEYWVKDFTYATKLYNGVVKSGKVCTKNNMKHCNKLYKFYIKPIIAKDFGIHAGSNIVQYNKDTFDHANEELNKKDWLHELDLLRINFK